jgi:YD repeat-containing protein
MKGLTGILFLLMMKTAVAQYYYKDIVLTAQTTEKWKAFQKSKVSDVKLISYETNGQPTEGFECNQTVARDFSSINTFTHGPANPISNLTAFYDTKGLLKKTIDTSDSYQSTTEYEYDANGHIASITNTSLETDNHIKDSEKHEWKYNQNGTPVSMLKIKLDIDTTYVTFKTDEKGNIIEESAIHNRQPLPTIYYYYNNDKMMTDIVRFNVKAQRLLPDYIFEYDANNRVSSMLVVTAGTSDYQKWLYQYNENGLKSMEACFNKKRELLGKVEYQYNYFR